MLKVNADVQRSDYLEYIVPFVTEIVDDLPHSDFGAEDVKPLLKSQFGLSIPKSAVEIVLQRLVGRRRLQRAHRRYSKVVGGTSYGGLSIARTEALRREKIVINSLISFAESKGCDWTSENATEAFLAYLNSFSIDCLRTYAQGTALPEIREGSKSLELYVVNAFIKHAHETSVELFDNIMVLVKGHMLANALICPDLDGTRQKFSDVVFFLDTPLVLDVIGLHGEEPRAAATELLDLLRRLKGTIAIFEHTYLEVDGVIRSAESKYADNEARARVVVEAKRAGRTASDLALCRARLEQTLEEAGVKKTPRPPFEAAFQIDEKRLEEDLRVALGYFYEGAARHDVELIRSIYALRRGRAPTRAENCRAIAVTTNPIFARVAYKFGQMHESSREVSTVITDFSLANIAWLKAPLGAPDLPRLEVLANCYAAMEPPPNIWKKYLDEVDRLRKDGRISPEDHEILRFSIQARDELMDVVLGETEQISASTVQDVMNKVKADLVRDKDSTIREQQEKLASEAESASRLKSERDELLSSKARRQKRAFWLADTIAKWIARSLFAVIALVVIAAGLAWPIEKLAAVNLPHAIASPFASVCSAVVVLLGICGTIWGTSVKDVTSAVRSAIARKVFRIVLRIMMEEPAEDLLT